MIFRPVRNNHFKIVQGALIFFLFILLLPTVLIIYIFSNGLQSLNFVSIITIAIFLIFSCAVFSRFFEKIEVKNSEVTFTNFFLRKRTINITKINKIHIYNLDDFVDDIGSFSRVSIIRFYLNGNITKVWRFPMYVWGYERTSKFLNKVSELNPNIKFESN